MQAIVIMGPPGAGKGTAGAHLASGNKFTHISTGDRIRHEMRNTASPLGRECRPYMERGDYLPDEMAINFLREIIQKEDSSKTLIFDGFPRTLPQAKALEELLKEFGGELKAAILLETDATTAVKRIDGRRICGACDKVYHLEVKAPRVENVCDECSGPLIKRDDDEPLNAKSRMRNYLIRIQDIITHYEAKKLLFKVDASGTVENTAEQIIKVMKEIS